MKYKLEPIDEIPATPELNALAELLEKIKMPPTNVVKMPTMQPTAIALHDWPII